MAKQSDQVHAPVGGRLFTPMFFGLGLLVLVAGFFLFNRFVFGLGSVTNLSDGYPWGIWIAIDLVVGTALGCAGYAVALLVYILNRGEYHPLVRPALLASLFGYALGGAAVMIDLGRYWQGYNMFLPWLSQYNSVMLETALCIAAYITVLMVEFSPVFLERLGMKNIRRRLDKVLFIFIGLGVLLPTMHQSSMGTILVVLGHQLSPLWQTQLLPLLFLTSALFMGFAIVVFEAVLASVGFRRPMEAFILNKLSTVMAWLLLGFVVVRIADLLFRGDIVLAFRANLDALMFWVEIALHVTALVLLWPRRIPASPRRMFLSASTMLAAGAVYRINCYLVGYHPGDGWNYFPSVGEIMVTVGIFALEIMLYLVFVKRLPVLHTVDRAYREEHAAQAREGGAAAVGQAT
ncbi:MAG: Ni/Fe-hydrogenase cytochrome b subunit [Rhodospirillaceae bacterium]|nr:Ni/Fe-hydrogenase cytochrome b subunit [Rhodospirillaceae bacterium]